MLQVDTPFPGTRLPPSHTTPSLGPSSVTYGSGLKGLVDRETKPFGLTTPGPLGPLPAT